MPKKGAEIVDVEVYLKLDRPLSWLVASTDTAKEAWIPKSVGELEEASRDGKGIAIFTLTIPRWKAEAEGLV